MDGGIEPRINGKHLPKYVSQTVRVVAKVIRLQGERAIVEMSDGAQIEVILSPDSHMSDQYVELVARVNSTSELRMYAVINLGDNLDMAAVNHTIELMHTRVMAPYWHTTP
ncbi:hypothetical protein FRC14_004503 [Serendipita sp. 396]|nr:hypothetical protein FRC14_004503 [Serendipita sp. 396]KAG8788058.1 hypothetical protein FRC15_006377 [Serendipita sp. 397]KAG8803054.1 hypothetical protein FRC16_007564 [Serendipita sp. 398]KAG8859195.1 hypothetical protein FRB91_008690 [Serendipita sp. 411]KAG8874139.1 hypothetical protein FRC20_006650 [Serendipita sp. 405]